MSKVLPACAFGLVLVAVAMWTKLILSDQGGVGYEAGKIRTPYVVRWIPWSPGIVENFRQQGRVVWLNFYAEWDMTHKVNRMKVFGNDSVLDMLAQNRVVLIQADMTYPGNELVSEMERYGRYSLPTDLIFPPDDDREMIVLPEVHSPEIVVAALNQAASSD